MLKDIHLKVAGDDDKSAEQEFKEIGIENITHISWQEARDILKRIEREDKNDVENSM